MTLEELKKALDVCECGDFRRDHREDGSCGLCGGYAPYEKCKAFKFFRHAYERELAEQINLIFQVNEASITGLWAEVERLTKLIDTPHTDDFMSAVPLEAAHQIKHWGVEHDDGKAPEDWFWLVGYLAGKCLHAAKAGDVEKAKHHTISTAACMLNWFRRLTGDDETFRPGIESPDSETVDA